MSDFDDPNPPPHAEPGPYEPDLRGVPTGALEWERTYSTFTHLSLALFHVMPVPVVFALVMWLIKRDQSAFVDDHGKEAVNFQISLVIYAVVSGILVVVGIGVIMLVGVYVLGIVGMIMGAVAAHRGQFFRYPMSMRFLH